MLRNVEEGLRSSEAAIVASLEAALSGRKIDRRVLDLLTLMQNLGS